MHGEVESFDKVEPLRQLGKADDSDLGDIRKGGVHGRSPAGAFQGSPAGGGKRGPGIGAVSS
jgi:hypothetical protein